MKGKELSIICLFDEAACEPRELVEQAFLCFLEGEIEALLHGG